MPRIPDLIIRKIRDMITGKLLLPGKKLPSEQELIKLLNVPRPQIRAAFRKLELFGITNTKPQSGTYLADYSEILLDGLLDNISEIDGRFDPVAIAETREILEISAAEYAAARRNSIQLEKLKKASQFFAKNALHTRAVDDDIHFHLQIIYASCNKALISAYLFLVPSLLAFWKSLDIISSNMTGRIPQSIDEHRQILQAIEKGDKSASARAMKRHLDTTRNFAAILSSRTVNELK
ncbi:MAG: FadR family transcriptional regulator [Spirochaetales bacterium]|nr:FadR family transcriptional regulator [Spirochaetales bacterium]